MYHQHPVSNKMNYSLLQMYTPSLHIKLHMYTLNLHKRTKDGVQEYGIYEDQWVLKGPDIEERLRE